MKMEITSYRFCALIYTLPDCPRCEEVKQILNDNNFPMDVLDMNDPEVLADMRFNGCFEVVAPVIQFGDTYYTYEEFMNGKLWEIKKKN